MGMVIKILEIVIVVINCFSVLMLVIGVVLCAKNLLLAAKSGLARKNKIKLVLNARIELGSFVLLGLEVLIVADIIKTIINPTVSDVALLGTIVAIRTVISYFLNKEIDALEEEMEE